MPAASNRIVVSGWCQPLSTCPSAVMVACLRCNAPLVDTVQPFSAGRSSASGMGNDNGPASDGIVGSDRHDPPGTSLDCDVAGAGHSSGQ